MPGPDPETIELISGRRRAALGRIGWRIMLGAAMSFLLASLALAGVLDRIEVAPETRGETEIVIWLSQDVAYRSSSPKDAGRVIRIYFQQFESGLSGPGAIKEVLNAAAQGSVPRFVVTYPELDNAMTVAFAETVTFRVVPSGPRKISIFVRGAQIDGGSKR